MGTPCEIQLFASDLRQAEAAGNRVIDDVLRLEAKYSRYRPDSLLSAINRCAGEGGRIEVDEETAGLLNYAAACYEQSEGLFDISSGILRAAWRFDRNELPDPQSIESLLRRIGWHKIRWSPPLLSFPEAGMELDFGGIVKEYAADRAAVLCMQAGVNSGLINLGGDIKIVGPRADGLPWKIGIADPWRKGKVAKTLSLTTGALASSGDYERRLEIGGVRYGHILNPKTGWPVRHITAVSVISDFCVVAGSTATIAMLKEQAGPQWLLESGLRHFWVDRRGRTGGNLPD